MNEADWILRMWRYLDSSKFHKLIIGYERRLWDGTRVDILTDSYAIEVDWSHKWKESIGQAMWYASVTNKKPGICLLCKNINEESHHIYRCNTICVKYNIDLWIVDISAFVAIAPTGERVHI